MTLVLVYGRDVVGVHEAVAAECAKELGNSIDWPASQGQTAEETISQSDCWVEVGARISSNVDAEDHGCRPPKTDGEPVSELVLAESCDGCDGASKKHHHQRAPELQEWLTKDEAGFLPPREFWGAVSARSSLDCWLQAHAISGILESIVCLPFACCGCRLLQPGRVGHAVLEAVVSCHLLGLASELLAMLWHCECRKQIFAAELQGDGQLFF